MKTKIALVSLIIILLYTNYASYQVAKDFGETLSARADVIDLVNELKTCQSDLKSEQEMHEADLDENDKFIEDRCVCVSWHSSSSEPARTKEQICSSKNQRGYNSEIDY